MLLTGLGAPFASAEPGNEDTNIAAFEEGVNPENTGEPPDDPEEPNDEDDLDTDEGNTGDDTGDPDDTDVDDDVDIDDELEDEDEELEEELDMMPEDGMIRILTDADGAEYLDGHILISLEANLTSGFSRMRASNDQILSTMSAELSNLPGELDSAMSLGDGEEILATVDLPAGISVEAAIAAYERSSMIAYAQPVYMYRRQITELPDEVDQPDFNEDFFSDFEDTDFDYDDEDFFSDFEDNDFGSSLFGANELFAPPPSTAWRPNDPLVGAHGAISGTNPATHLDHVRTFQAWELLRVLPARSKTRVAVIDTQIQLNHPDLRNGQLLNSLARYFSTGWGIHWPNDDFHGTHVAGLIGATSNNGIGGAGVAAGRNNEIVEIVPINVFERINFIGGGWDLVAWSPAIIDALNYSVSAPVNARVINMSLGMQGRGDTAYRNALSRAHKAGATIVAAAGNFGDSRASFPSDHANVISVINLCHTTNGLNLATTRTPNWTTRSWVSWEVGVNPRSFSSSFGSGKNMSGPGSFVWGPVPPGQEVVIRSGTHFRSGYDALNGTSMASPVVAGVAAMMLYANPSLTPTQVANILYETATDVHTRGTDTQTGRGAVNAEAAVARAIALRRVAPAAPTVTRVNTFQTRVTWAADASATGGFRIFRKVGEGGTAVQVGTATNANREFLDFSINPGVTYFYSIVAVRGVDVSERGPERQITVGALPQLGTVSRSTDGPFRVRVSWPALNLAGFQTTYQVDRKVSGAADSTYVSMGPRVGVTNFTDPNAVPGTSYTYRVTPFFTQITNGSNVQRGLARESAAFVAPTPAAPTGLTGTINTGPNGVGTNNGSITLNWRPVSGAQGYSVYRKLSTQADTAYTRISPANLTATTFTDTTALWGGATGNTYNYVIAVRHPTITTEGTRSAPVNVALTSSALRAPTITSVVSDGPTSARVNWSAASPGAKEYRIFRRLTTDQAFPVSPIHTMTVAPSSTVTTFNWTDPNVVPATGYTYMVVAVRDILGSTNITTSSAVRAYTSPRLPAVTGLRVQPGTLTNTGVTMDWNAVAGARGYTLFRDGVQIRSWDVAPAANTGRIEHRDNDLTPGTAARYTVQAYWAVAGSNSAGPLSSAVTANPPGAAPGGVRVTINSPTQITVNWNVVANASSYRVYLGSGFVNVPATQGVTQMSRQFTNLNPSTQYQVRVAGMWNPVSGAAREGRMSNAVNANTTGPAPSGLRVQPQTLENTRVTMDWNPVAGANGYFIYNNGTQIAQIPSSTPQNNGRFQYTDNTLTPGTAARYTVRAYWTVGGVNRTGNATSVVTVNPPGAAPGSVRATVNSPTAVTVIWNEVVGVSSYNVYIGNRAPVSIRNDAPRSHQFTGLDPNTQYQIRVVGLWTPPGGGAAREGRISTVNTTTTGPAPTNLRASNITSFSARLTWNAVTTAGVEGYIITRNNGTPPVVITNQQYEANGYNGWTDNTLQPGVQVRYTVQAYWRVGTVNRPGRATSALSVTATGGAAPGGVRATVESPSVINVTWNAVAGANGYRVYVNDVAQPNSPESATSRQITSLTPGTRYQIRVASLWNSDTGLREGRASSNVNATTTGPAPTSLRASNITQFGARLTWNHVTTPGVTGYLITRNDGSAPVTITSPNVVNGLVTWDDTALRPGTQVRYTVQAIWNIGGTNRPGLAAAVNVTPTGGAAPGSVRATVNSPTAITVTWNAVAGVSGYRVYVNDVAQPSTIPEATRSHQITSLNPNTRYQIRVVGLWNPPTGAAREGRSSANVNATTTGPAPTGLRAKMGSLSATAVTLEWNAVPGASGYNILRDGTQVATFAVTPTANTGLIERNVTGMTSGQVANFSVQAYWITANRHGTTSPQIRVITLPTS